MKNPIELIFETLNSITKPVKIVIEKSENVGLDVNVSADDYGPALLGLVFMDAMVQIAEKSESHKFAIMSACDVTLSRIRKGGQP